MCRKNLDHIKLKYPKIIEKARATEKICKIWFKSSLGNVLVVTIDEDDLIIEKPEIFKVGIEKDFDEKAVT